MFPVVRPTQKQKLASSLPLILPSFICSSLHSSPCRERESSCQVHRSQGRACGLFDWKLGPTTSWPCAPLPDVPSRRGSGDVAVSLHGPFRRRQNQRNSLFWSRGGPQPPRVLCEKE
ncbi:hypothetical protein Cadr_000021531 [Camelus dromedarius]|uniref:Uncharacterized protein n=1 Tax=Camelus dromedarius TaxID=9838 RepID=A0A5N4CVK7_CAMDR|nr:hypothetical protein Cadr_000021531 [Camelus dromedarius]